MPFDEEKPENISSLAGKSPFLPKNKTKLKTLKKQKPKQPRQPTDLKQVKVT